MLAVNFYMVKYYSFILILGITFSGVGQIAIGTQLPDAMLDVTVANSMTPSNTDGILIPRIENLPTTDPTINQDGMLIYLTQDDGNREKGFYYWIEDYNQWVPFFQEWSKNVNANGEDLIESRQANNGIYFKDENRLLGIGNDDPEETFEMRHEQVDNNIQIRSTGSLTQASLLYYTRLGTPATPAFLDPNNVVSDEDENIGYLTGKVFSGFNKSGDIVNVRFEVEDTHSVNNFPTRIVFSTAKQGNLSDGNNRSLVIDKDGNVGVGPDPDNTVAPKHFEPEERLDVNGDLSIKDLGNGFVPVYATSNGTLYDGPRIIAAGKLNGSGGVINSKAYNINTSVRNSTGNYTITINFAKPNYIINLATSNCSTCVIYYEYVDSATFNVLINDIITGNPVNNQFMFSVIDFN